MTNIRERLNRGETLAGCFLSLGSALTAEIAGLAGFDWVLIDLEHGAGCEREALGQMQALGGSGCGVVVRVESHERQRIHRVLDMGADGIMAPRVDSVEDAERVVSAMRYPPEGVRGVAQMIRASGFGAEFASYAAATGSTLLGVIQIESLESLACVEQIASTPGVDVLFVGPSDLSQSMGILGQFDAPQFAAALERVAGAAETAGKAAGILIRTPEEYPRYRALGYRFIACGSDASFLNAGARRVAVSLREQIRAGL
jgi:4-hydroxy-2-oxoheptanedioate aldolase